MIPCDATSWLCQFAMQLAFLAPLGAFAVILIWRALATPSPKQEAIKGETE